jgi:hypothetical protein
MNRALYSPLGGLLAVAAAVPREPRGNDAIMRSHDPAIAVETHGWDDRVDIGAGVAVTLAPARHW